MNMRMYQFTGLTLFRSWEIDTQTSDDAVIGMHDSWFFDNKKNAQEACDMLNLVEGPETHFICDNGEYEKSEFRYEVWTEYFC